jgi:hypothetical protein
MTASKAPHEALAVGVQEQEAGALEQASEDGAHEHKSPTDPQSAMAASVLLQIIPLS